MLVCDQKVSTITVINITAVLPSTSIPETWLKQQQLACSRSIVEDHLYNHFVAKIIVIITLATILINRTLTIITLIIIMIFTIIITAKWFWSRDLVTSPGVH